MDTPNVPEAPQDAADPVHGREAERWGGWTWREPSRGEHYRTCTHCGSIHPDDLTAESDWHAQWADRKYGWPHKFYVDIPNRHPDQRHVIGANTGHAEPASTHHLTWVRADAIPDDVITDGWRNLASTFKWVGLGTRRVHHAKFYTAHLADPNLAPSTVDRVQRVSGIRFRFRDGRVTWEQYADT